MFTMSSLEKEGRVAFIVMLIGQCEYHFPELPCKLCQERGLICGAGDKVWGRYREERQGTVGLQVGRSWSQSSSQLLPIVHRPVPTPDDEVLSPLEIMAIQQFCNNTPKWPKFAFPIYFTPIFGFERYRFCIFHRYGPNLRSSLLRHSIRLMLTFGTGENVPLTTLGQMYPCMSEAITHHRYFELAIATWSLSAYGLEGRLPWNEMESHLKGFWQSLRKALTLNLTTEEWCWLIWMYGYIFISQHQRHIWPLGAVLMSDLPLTVTLASTLDLRLDISRKFDKLIQRAGVSVRNNCTALLASVKIVELQSYLDVVIKELNGSQAYRSCPDFDIALHKHLLHLIRSLAETYAQYGLDPITHVRSELPSYIPRIHRADDFFPSWYKSFILSVYEGCLHYCFLHNASLLPVGLDLIEMASLIYQIYDEPYDKARTLLPGIFLLLHGTPNGLFIITPRKADDRSS